MYATQRFLPDESLQCFDAKSEFTECQGTLGGNPPGKASDPHNLGNRIAERRVPCKTLLVHASQHRYHHIRIVVDVDFALVVVEAMQAAHVLLQSTFPRNRHCEKKRIKTWVVKSLAEVTSGRKDH